MTPMIQYQSFFFGDYYKTVRSGCQAYFVFSDGRDDLGAKLYLGKVDHCDQSIGFSELNPITSKLKFGAIYPQPVLNHEFHIRLTIEKEANLSALLYNDNHQVVAQWGNRKLFAGQQIESFHLPDHLTSGVYFVQFKVADRVAIRKLIVADRR